MTTNADLHAALERFESAYNEVADIIHSTAVEKGWWEKPPGFHEIEQLIIDGAADSSTANRLLKAVRDMAERNEAEMICLEHSELSEALEAIRHGNPPDDKIPAFTSVSVELADNIIRIMDHGKGKEHDVAGALVAKILFNMTRAYKHGGKKF